MNNEMPSRTHMEYEMATPQDFGLNKPIYSLAEFMRLTSTGRTKAYELLKNGEIRAVRRGKNTQILAADLAAYLAKLPQWRA